MFNENTLYAEIAKVWGENGAHAEVYRDICEKAGVDLEPLLLNETIDDKVRRFYKEEDGRKINVIKRLRWEEPDLDLLAAKRLVESVKI